MNKLGFHISDQHGASSAWPARFNSAIHLILATGVGGETNRALQVAQVCPNALIVYRAWTYGSVGHSDQFRAYYQQYGTNPLPLVRAHESVFSALASINHRVTYQFFNETGCSEEDWPLFVDFNTQLIREMDRRGLSASVFGAAPGNPSLGAGSREDIRRGWGIAYPVFEAIFNAHVQHYVNLHEYMGYPISQYEPYIVGRYQWMLEDIAVMGLPTDKIKVYAGEIGYTHPGSLGQPGHGKDNGYLGWLQTGLTPEQLAEEFVSAHRRVYDGDPHFVGSCYFCLGDSGGWAEFDLLKEPRLLQRMYDLLDHEHQEEISVIETPVTAYKVANGPLNIRLTASTSAEKIGTLAVGVTVQTNGYAEVDGIRWRRLAEQAGYCAEVVLSDPSAPFMVTAPDWKAGIVAQIEAIRAQLAQLEAAIQAV